MRGSPVVYLAMAMMACGPSASRKPSVAAGDSAFAGVQARGGVAMGVNQYTSRHVFEPLPDGGRIALQRDAADSDGAAQIRRHMHEIAGRFAAGDFTLPGFVHARVVPGTEIMAAHAGGHHLCGRHPAAGSGAADSERRLDRRSGDPRVPRVPAARPSRGRPRGFVIPGGDEWRVRMSRRAGPASEAVANTAGASRRSRGGPAPGRGPR